LIISVFFSSCSIIDPAEDIPAYLHIDQYTLTTNFDQGTASTISQMYGFTWIRKLLASMNYRQPSQYWAREAIRSRSDRD
jgi:hypothetical protein